MLDKGVIRKLARTYGSPVVIVRKKNGAVQLTVDYCRLNSKTVKNYDNNKFQFRYEF